MHVLNSVRDCSYWTQWHYSFIENYSHAQVFLDLCLNLAKRLWRKRDFHKCANVNINKEQKFNTYLKQMCFPAWRLPIQPIHHEQGCLKHRTLFIISFPFFSPIKNVFLKNKQQDLTGPGAGGGVLQFSLWSWWDRSHVYSETEFKNLIKQSL